MHTIRGRRALVTGAASGIGRAIALQLAAEGAELLLTDRDEGGLRYVASVAAERTSTVRTEVCDLLDPSQIKVLVEKAVAWGQLNIIVNCAGVLPYGPSHLSSYDDWRDAVAVNLLAPMQIIQGLLPTLMQSDEAHVLNVCSILGLTSWRNVAAYQATKFGLVGFTSALRSELHRRNIGVTALCPGFVRTPLLTELRDHRSQRVMKRIPKVSIMSSEIVAAKALDAIRYDRGLVVITSAYKVIWWLSRLSPTLVDWVVREGWRRRGNRFDTQVDRN